MKYHLIYPDINTGFYPSVHHGIAQLSAVLKTNGHEVSLHHVTKEPKREDIVSTALSEFPDIIGFTTMTNQVKYVEKWSQWIKRVCNIPIVCGGVHATLNPEEVLEFEGVDAVCVGDGESAILGFSDVKNYGVKFITRHSLVENLDDLPFPDYGLFDFHKMLKARGGDFAVIVSRGCVFSCSFCCSPALREKQKDLGKYFRFRSVDNTLEMLQFYISQYPITRFSFADDIFGINKEWAFEFCEKYPHKVGLGIPFECNLRVEMVSKDLLKALKDANCAMVEMGIESGDYWMRSKVLNRKMTNKQIVDAFENARKLGIKTRAYNMIGLPYETPNMARGTLELNKLVEPDDVAVFYFYPYMGTKLYDVCKRAGFLNGKQSTGYVTESVLKSPYMSERELRKVHDEFYRYIVDRKSQSYGAVGSLFRMGAGLLRLLTWGNEVEMIRWIYMRLFPLFQKLRG